MNFYSEAYPYSSARTTVYAKNGVVASSQYLASQAGLDVLKKGGNAVDAALACAACLTVTEPTSNGIGGDAFAIVWYKNQLYGLNASGPAPSSLRAQPLLNKGFKHIDKHSWEAVTVPGLPAAWGSLASRFGNFPLHKSIEAAVQYAEKGYPVSPVVSANWKKYLLLMDQEAHGELYSEWRRVFAPKGRAPLPGELWQSPELAQTLISIGESNGADFYRGDLAQKICAFAKSTGGYLHPSDLMDYKPEWVTPLHSEYRDYSIWELPPNGHGLVVLLALNIMKQFSFQELSEQAQTHIAIEAIKLAFADAFKWLGDPNFTDIPITDLLSEEYARSQSRTIGDTSVSSQLGRPLKGGTVYLATADSEGNMVSYIQSNYTGFGSGIVVPGTGIALHNRGSSFDLNPRHPNYLEPGKRPYHTIIPGFIMKNNQPIGPFGVMGAMMQPQGHIQMIINTIDRGLNPQASLDCPRWQWVHPDRLYVEPQFPQDTFEFLSKKNHPIQLNYDTASFGRGQIIFYDQTNNLYICGTEPRADSLAACW